MRNRSYFWPAILILTGVLALVAETGAISGERLLRLADLWPVILIVIGLELVNRRVLQGPRRDLATALIVVALTALRARAFVSHKLGTRAAGILPIFSSLVIVGFGVFFLLKGAGQV